MLGSKCVKCGSIENLQFDHVYPKDKKFAIMDRIDTKWNSLLEEIKKCQLLCKKCHIIKTSNDVLAKHGTNSRYSHRSLPCRCILCKKANAVWRTKWRKERKEKGLVVW